MTQTLLNRSTATRENALTDAERDAFLSELRIARIATMREDGWPHVTPIWYVYEDGRLRYAGKVGAGFTNDTRPDLLAALGALESQAAYLDRLGLLGAAERLALPDEAFRPETFSPPSDDGDDEED